MKIIFAVFLLCSYILAQAPPNGTPLFITASDVNFRATPCTDGRVIRMLQSGNRGTSLGEARTVFLI